MSSIAATNFVDRASSDSVPVADVQAGYAKVWINFNGTGTIAANDSFNVTSLTDNGTGSYTVNFTNALPNSNYCQHVSAGSDTSWSGTQSPTQVRTTTSCNVYTGETVSAGAYDWVVVMVSIFCNL